MEPVVGGPYPGFRIRRQYQRLISKNPANSGSLYKDPNGRPSGMVLASLYLGPGHDHYYDGNTNYFYLHRHQFHHHKLFLGVDDCKLHQRYPGQYQTNPKTTFQERYIE